MAEQSELMSAARGTLWVQPDGPNTVPLILPCHDLGDVTEPKGEVAERYCVNPITGQYQVVLRTRGTPGRATLSITTYVGKVRDALEKLAERGCPFSLYAHSAEGKKQGVFGVYDRGEVYMGVLMNSLSRSNLAMREADDATEQTFECSLDGIGKYYPLRITRAATTEAEDAMCVFPERAAQCADGSGPGWEKCDYLWVTCQAAAAATANVLRSVDGGLTWAATAADPFVAAEDISCGVSVQVGKSTWRQIVARGTTDAANPAEIAWTEDNGATWHPVNLGTTVADFVPWTNGLFALDLRHVWAVTNLGEVYFSEDGGLTWAAQPSTNVAALNAVHFASESLGAFAGATNALYLTEDGGEHWTALVGPAAKAADDILSVQVLSRNRLWLGYDDGEAWYSLDGGATWAQRQFTISDAATVDRVNAIAFLNEHRGYMAVKYTDGAADVFGAILHTVNGGETWHVLRTSEYGGAAFDVGANGLASVLACDWNRAVAVGDLISATAAIFSANAA
jgi:photosystem II stability/assembly factor-like uncharacterized protein